MNMVATIWRKRAEARRNAPERAAALDAQDREMLRRRMKDRQSGFTLIEAILIIALLAVGMTGVFYLTAVGTDMNINTREEMLAYQSANEYMDYLRQQPYAALGVTTDQPFGTTAGTVGYESLARLSNAQGVYTVSDYQSNNGDTVKQLTVKVNWSRKSAALNRTVTVSTLAVEGGLNERWK